MRKSHYSARQADNLFSSLTDAFKAIKVGTHILSVEGDALMHGVVTNKWNGYDPRVVVRFDNGKVSALRDISDILIRSDRHAQYIPSIAYARTAVAR